MSHTYIHQGKLYENVKGDFKCSLCGSINDQYIRYERKSFDQELSRDCYKCGCPQKIFIPKFIDSFFKELLK